MSQPSQLQVCRSNLGNATERFCLARASSFSEWELLLSVNACTVMEMLELNNVRMMQLLDLADLAALAKANANVSECVMWVALITGYPDLAVQLPVLNTVRFDRLLQRDDQRQSCFATILSRPCVGRSADVIWCSKCR